MTSERGDGVGVGVGPRACGGRDPDALALSRAATANSEALGNLYRYAPGVRAYVASIVRDSHEAEDITRQVSRSC